MKECFIGFSNLKSIILNVFTKESSFSLFELKGDLIQDNGRADLDALHTSAKQSVGIQVQGIFKIKNT